MKKIGAYIAMARPQTFILVGFGGAASGYISYKCNQSMVDFSHITLALFLFFIAIAAILFNTGSNAINQIFDIEIDRISKPNRPLPKGDINKNEAWVFSILCYLSSLLIIFIITHGKMVPIWLFLLGAFISVAYSAPPFRLKRYLLWTNLSIAISRGPLLMVAAWSFITNTLNQLDPWLYGSILGMFFLGAISAKDFVDIEGDRAEGISTLPIKFGVTKAAKIIYPFLFLPFMGLGTMSTLMYFQIIPKTLSGNVVILAILGWVLTAIGLVIGKKLIKDPYNVVPTQNMTAGWWFRISYIVYFLGLILSYAFI